MANFEGDKRSKYNIQNIHLDMVSLVKEKKGKTFFFFAHVNIASNKMRELPNLFPEHFTLSGGGGEDAVLLKSRGK